MSAQRLRALLGAAVLASSAAVLGGCSAEHEGAAQSAIVNGEVTEQYPAVGVLTLRRSRCEQLPDTALCSVTLVADKLVLTAGHCVVDYRERMLSVRFGAGLGDAEALEYPVVRHILHPQYDDTSSDHDAALLVLSDAPPIAPLALSAAPLDDSWLGRSIMLVGYGESGDGENSSEESDGLKRMGLAEIEQIEPHTFRYLPMPAATCRGDSGGPALWIDDGTPAVIGVTSAGDSDCLSHGVHVRVDTLLTDFIEPALQQLSEPPQPSVQPGALCEQPCVDDGDCPAQLLCRPDSQGIGRCGHPQLEAGSFEQACTTDAQCASGLCAPLADSCACYTPCAGEEEHEPADKGALGKGAEGAATQGCTAGGSPARDGSAGGWLGLLLMGWLLRRRRRSRAAQNISDIPRRALAHTP